ncbi:MAG: hypothetical protein JNL88_06785 [Bacteroidia bacterium]|nr:hypothetical protein [Bacteroidia bacterium]
MRNKHYLAFVFVLLLISAGRGMAQDGEAKMSLAFEKGDSLNSCKVIVTAADTPVADIDVKLYVQRLFSLLPVGDAVTTDEEGIASFEFPSGIPADLDGKLSVVARIEDDETFGNAEVKGSINWGVARKAQVELGRSLSGSRGNAPVYFIVVSNLIIAGIWGTLIYVVLQLFRIRKISRHLQSNKQA